MLLLSTGCVSGGIVQVEQPTTPSVGYNSHFIYTEEFEVDPYPAVVTILYEGVLIGTGVLIKPSTVLTAGHVVDLPGEYTIICNGVEHCVLSIKLHPRFNPFATLIPNYIEVDLAIVKLETPSEVIPIKLMDKGHKVFFNEPLEVIGHGTGRKRFCNDGRFWYFGRMLESPWDMIMLPTEETVWFGDSGGAIIDDDDNVLIGIVSAFGRRKGRITHNIGSWVGSELDWINENL